MFFGNLLIAALLAATSQTATGPATADAHPSGKPAPVPAEFGMPGVVPVAQLWADFYARADEETAFDESAVADDLYPQNGVVDKAKCRAKQDNLDRAARRVPVGFEIWFVRRACAQALGDTKRVDESERAIAALTRYAFAQLPPDHGASAIQVFRLGDAYALALATGDKVIYDFFDLADIHNGYPLVLGLRDPQTGHERELRFDFVSAIIGIRRESEDQEYPGQRSEIARATIRSMAKKESDSAATDAVALIDTRGEGDATRVDSLVKQARGGSYPAALAMATCFLEKTPACTQQAVDALLPFAEKGYARPMVLLAFAYGTGQGVRQDPEAAKTMFQGAAKRIGDPVAYGIFAATGLRGKEQTPIDAWLFEKIARAADGGDPYAAQLAALFSYVQRGEPDSGANPREQAWLDSAERAGLPAAARVLAADAIQRKDPSAATYMTKWADKDADIAAQLAAAYEAGTIAGIPRDTALAMKWRRRAGMLGDIGSMRIVGFHDMALDTPDARVVGLSWLYSAAITGDLGATLDLAYALTNTPGLDPEDAKRGVSIYRAVMADHDSPRARRAFATLLMEGRGVDKDIVQAKQLLLKDADAGDTDSQLALARALFMNKLGNADPDEAWSWVRKADAKGSHSAAYLIAVAMFDGTYGMPVDRKKALESLDKLFSTGYVAAGNNYAWDLCTGPDAALRDATKGLVVITKVGLDSPTSTHLDTQAACLAATADFSKAVDFQQRAIASLPPNSGTDLADMQSRLTLYKNKQAYVQDIAKAAVVSPPANHP